MKKIFLIVLLLIFMAKDYGAAVAQKGYDVKTCADRFLVYSSAFQTLKVHSTYAVSTTRPASGVNTITITHNLGYYAPFIVIYNGSTSRGVGTSFFMNDGDYTFTMRQYTDRLEIDVDDFFDLFGSNDGDTVYFTVYLFLDDFSTITDSTRNTGTSSGASSNDYGFRISKPGFDVKTCANIDCILSSSFFNQIVHKKGIDTTGEVAHNLGYIPNILTYIKPSGQSFLTSYGFLNGSVDSINLYPAAFGGDSAYYIIFKDKLN